MCSLSFLKLFQNTRLITMGPIQHSLLMTSIKVTLSWEFSLRKEFRVSQGDYCYPLLGKYKKTYYFLLSSHLKKVLNVACAEALYS